MAQRVLLLCLLFCPSFWMSFTNAVPFRLQVPPALSLSRYNLIQFNPFRKKPFLQLWNRITFTRKVITSLQDEILVLERHLRQSKQESSQLRTLLQQQLQTRRRGDSAQVLQSVQAVKTLREELKSLNQQCNELTKTKTRLEKVVQEEQKRYKLLQEEMEELKQNHIQKVQEVAKEGESKLECLKTDLLDKAKQQVAALQEQHLGNVQQEIQKIQKESEKAMQQEQEKLKAMTKQYEKLQVALRIKGKEAEADLGKLRNDLKAERKRGEEAVDKEKIKMRKLVKALAAKEKKELAAMKKKTKVDVSGGGGTSRPSGSQRANVSVRAGKRTKK